MKDKSAIVVGSGIAGIATALRLTNKGYQVHVFEGNSEAGGKLGVLETSGFRWDTGPSLFTLPHLVDELFRLFNEDPREHFQYHKKDIVCNYFWSDGASFSVPANKDEFVQKAALFFEENETIIDSYLNNSLLKYDLTSPLFLERSLHKSSSYLTINTLNALLKINKLDLNSTLHEVNKSTFKNPKLIQFFDRFATYNGSSPYKTPGIMSMIPSLEMQQGTFFPAGGMRSIIESLYQLALRHGVSFSFNEMVNEIVVKESKAVGVKTNKRVYESDLVVSNMDIYHTYSKLLPTIAIPQKIESQERSSSAIIFYWGVKKQFPELDLHNIFFSANYEKEFNQLFDAQTVPNDPTIYLNISCKEQESDAPKGAENWFVMVNAPANKGQNWSEIERLTKKTVINKLNKQLNINLSELIVCETILNPIKIEEKTSSFQGSLYGSSSNSKYAAFLRHPNFKSKLDNLYFCGGSVHPGGGIPLCLKSAKIVSDLVI